MNNLPLWLSILQVANDKYFLSAVGDQGGRQRRRWRCQRPAPCLQIPPSRCSVPSGRHHLLSFLPSFLLRRQLQALRTSLASLVQLTEAVSNVINKTIFQSPYKNIEEKIDRERVDFNLYSIWLKLLTRGKYNIWRLREGIRKLF